MDEVTIYTDGACSGNPGPGGWGSVLIYKEIKKSGVRSRKLFPHRLQKNSDTNSP